MDKVSPTETAEDGWWGERGGCIYSSGEFSAPRQTSVKVKLPLVVKSRICELPFTGFCQQFQKKKSQSSRSGHIIMTRVHFLGDETAVASL